MSRKRCGEFKRHEWDAATLRCVRCGATRNPLAGPLRELARVQVQGGGMMAMARARMLVRDGNATWHGEILIRKPTSRLNPHFWTERSGHYRMNGAALNRVSGAQPQRRSEAAA